MINSRKRQLVIILILFCICVPVLGVDPNEPETELKFEISARERQLGFQERVKFEDSVKPKYVAIFTMSDLSRFYNEPDITTHDMVTTKMILATSAGQSMSEIQKELLKADKVIFAFRTIKKSKKLSMFSYTVRESEFGLYAFTAEDAKLATKAFIETMNKKAREKLPPLLEEVVNGQKQKMQVYREKIADTKKKLSEKEPELKPAESAYRKLKNTDQYGTLADSEAYEKARETIAQMNKMLSILDIELAGIREKLAIIEKYRESDKFSNATLEKLEQMFVEQMVEFRGAEARKGAAIDLRNRGKQFCDFFNAWVGLENEVKSLRNSLRNSEERVRSYEEEIANPHPQLLPPKVLQNKVTIYPVLAEE
jgi:hypothetical protein